jgi:hypothetical protein
MEVFFKIIISWFFPIKTQRQPPKKLRGIISPSPGTILMINKSGDKNSGMVDQPDSIPGHVVQNVPIGLPGIKRGFILKLQEYCPHRGAAPEFSSFSVRIRPCFGFSGCYSRITVHGTALLSPRQGVP